MKKTLGRLAGAVLAGALISLAVTPSALAQDNPTTATTTSAVAPPTSGTPATNTPTSGATATGTSTSDTPTSSGQPTDTSKPTGQPTGKPTGTTSPTGTSEPTKTTTSAPETTTPEEPYQDDIAFGIDLDGGQGIFAIACAAGEPTGVSSHDFDLIEGPHQDETDGRYWLWLVKRHDGASFDAGNIRAAWTCGGKGGDNGGDKGNEHPVPPAGGAGAGSAGTTGGQGNSQVKYAPKGGIETGFGGTAA